MKLFSFLLIAFIAVLLPSPAAFSKTVNGKPLVVMIADKPSHGPGLHEYNAGCCSLRSVSGGERPTQWRWQRINADWPSPAELAQVDTILIFSDGGEKHPALQGDRLAQLTAQIKRGCGFVCLHYALEVPAENGGSEFIQWLGGYFEVNWSINPRWAANIPTLPPHPICRGVKPFGIDDELYYHMRFKEGMAGVTPILSAVPPDKSFWPKDNARGGNPTVRAAVAAKSHNTSPGSLSDRTAVAALASLPATRIADGRMTSNASCC